MKWTELNPLFTKPSKSNFLRVHQVFSIKMKLPAASGRGIKEDNINFIPSPYPSPQGEGTDGFPTASGWGIEKI